ncbi:hypothetical protein CCAE64S_02355 [Castellaniella caeni]
MTIPTIALVMIVKNGAATLARCLASVREHVDQMIVLDTGSVDETHWAGVLHAFGAVHRHTGYVCSTIGSTGGRGRSTHFPRFPMEAPEGHWRMARQESR